LLMHLASLFFSAQPRAIRSLHSFPTRRSSDLRTPVDAILWATGFRHELRHLRPLGLTGPLGGIAMDGTAVAADPRIHLVGHGPRSEEHTSELQSRENLVCRLLLEKKNNTQQQH